MATLRSIVSSIRGMNKLFSADNKITDRLLASEIKSAAFELIKQETNKRRLWQSPNLFTPINCLPMIAVPLTECCNYVSDCKIGRSKDPLPKIAEGIFGLLIQEVADVNNRQTFDFASPTRYENILKMKIKTPQYIYWIKNDYLYITDPLVEVISISAYFEEDVPSELLNCSGGKPCINPLDNDFRFPGYMEKRLKDMVYQSLLNTYFRHLQDPQPDGKDDAR
jgi:hypothetical protein